MCDLLHEAAVLSLFGSRNGTQSQMLSIMGYLASFWKLLEALMFFSDFILFR